MKNKFSIAMSLAVVLAILLTSLVLADTIQSDGDVVTANTQTTVNLGTVAPGATLNPKISFQLSCDGNKHVDSGQSVVLSYSSGNSTVPAGGSLTATQSTIGAIPATWPDDGNTTCTGFSPIGDNGDSTVTITAPSTGGTYSFVVGYTAALNPEGSNDPASITGAVPTVTYTLTVSAPPPPSDTTAPSISYVLSPASPDGAHGWYRTNVSLVWTVTDPESSVTKTGCVDQNITSDQAATTYTCSASSAGGTAATVSVTIQRDATAPTIVATPDLAVNAYGWNNSAVTVSYSCTDNGPSGVDAAASDLGNDVLSASGTANGTCVDMAGNSSSAGYTAQIDTQKPVIAGSRTPAANTGGWNNTDVTVSFSCTDSGGSGIDTNTIAGATLSTEGVGQSVTNTGTCTDKAGNTADLATVSNINIDKTAPTISAGRTPAANANGWNNTDVTSTYNASDSLSGLASAATGSFVFSSEGGAQSHTFTVSDIAGNSATATVSNVNIDKTKPVLNISGTASGASNVCSALPSRPSSAPTDALSGIDTQSDSWSTPSNPSGVGTYTYIANAADLAGNTATETRTYTVTYSSAFSGYLQPINTDGSSRFKLGSTIPVKFQLTCNGVAISSAVAKLYIAKGDNQPDPGVDEAISTAASTTGNLFRYDSTAQQYIFNLSTKTGYTNPGSNTATSFTTGSWTLKILLDDGNWYSVNVQLPK